jgi:hypothetical protein
MLIYIALSRSLINSRSLVSLQARVPLIRLAYLCQRFKNKKVQYTPRHRIRRGQSQKRAKRRVVQGRGQRGEGFVNTREGVQPAACTRAGTTTEGWGSYLSVCASSPLPRRITVPFGTAGARTTKTSFEDGEQLVLFAMDACWKEDS